MAKDEAWEAVSPGLYFAGLVDECCMVSVCMATSTHGYVYYVIYLYLLMINNIVWGTVGPLDIVDCIGNYAGGLQNQNISIPFEGDLLQRLTGSVCALSPRIPSFLNPGRSYVVELRGSRLPDGTPDATFSLVSIRDGLDFNRVDFLRTLQIVTINGEQYLAVTTFSNFLFACTPFNACLNLQKSSSLCVKVQHDA